MAEISRSRLGVKVQAAVFATLLLTTFVSDLLTFWLEQARRADPVATWKFVTWEASSRIAIAALIPVIYAVWARLHPSRLGWPRSLAGHAVASLAFSLVHVAAMVGMRKLVYAVAGQQYEFGPLPYWFFYEYQKDVISYLTILLFIWGMARLFPRPVAQSPGVDGASVPPSPPGDPVVFELRDGWRLLSIPATGLLRVEAAGNYVELVGPDRRVLYRATLASLEDRLKPAGFARVHRGHLVNLSRVARVHPTPNGDAVAVMDNGDRVPVSRRFRAALADAPPGPALGAADEVGAHSGSAKATT